MTRALKYALACAAAAVLSNPACAAGRTFVATTGADANTSVNCGPTAPCRTFNAALSVTDAGGEVVVLNSGGYGPMTITRSVSITAPSGVYAGITVASGYGITIETAGISVALTGLTINGPGVGGSYGIFLAPPGSGAVTLTVQNCSISNFPTTMGGGAGAAINAITTGLVRIVNTVMRDSGYGLSLEAGSADIVRSQFLGDDIGIMVQTNVGAETSSAAVTDTVLSGGSNTAIDVVSSGTSSTAHVSVVRSTVSSNQYGIYAFGSLGGAAMVSVDDSMIARNASYGVYQDVGAAITSFGNNAFYENGADAGGTAITTTTLK